MTKIKKQPKVEDGQSPSKQEVESLKGQLARALADYQNLEKRVVSDREGWIKYAGAEILSQLLPVLDTLKLALKNTPAESQEGLALAIKQFENVLGELGVAPVVTLEQKFDPVTMECTETVSGEPEEQVAEEITTGYLYRDRLLRPAMVKVYKKI